MPIRRIDHTYIKTRGANTNDILRVNSGNLEYISGNTVVIQALYGLAGNNVTIDANGKINATATGGGGSVTQANLTTANVVELNNLYFSNARVKDSISKQTLSNATFSGDIVVGGLLRASAQGGDEGGQIELANAITNSTLNGPINIDVYQNKLRIFESSGSNRGVYVDLSTASGGVGTNLIGGGTGTITQVGSVTTGGVPNSEIVSILTTTGVLTTANVTELNNLYYTNARVYANVVSALTTYTGNISAGNLIANSITTAGTSGNITGVNYITANYVLGNVISSGNVQAQYFLGNGALLTGITAGGFSGNTTGIAEGANLYYTNARVYSNVVSLLTTYTGNINAGNLIANSITTAGTSGNITGVNYITANYVLGNVVSSGNVQAQYFLGNGALLTGITAGGFSGNTTGIAEGANLYYTNARVYANVISLLPTYTGNVNAGNVIANTVIIGSRLITSGSGGNISGVNFITANQVLANVTASGNVQAQYFLGNGALLTGITAGGFSGNTTGIAEGANLYYTNARVYANVISLLPNYTGNLSAGNVNTGNLIITTSLSTSGAGGNISGADYIIANQVLANVTASGNVTAQYFLGNGALLSGITAGGFSGNTSGIAEGANLYYTNARVYANVISLLPNYTGNLAAGNINVGNLVISTTITTAGTGGNIGGANYVFANQVVANVTASGNVQAQYFLGNGALLTGITAGGFSGNTTGIAEGANLYYTNARVRANVVALLPNYGGNILAQIVEASIWNGLYTGNVTESGINLYFSNIRARQAVGASTGVIYDVNTGLFAIGQNVAPTANVTFNNLTVTGTTTYYGNVTTYNSNNLVVGENMIYLNDGDDTSNPDIGISGNYNDGTYKHTGFFRDATDGNWKVYDSYTPEPSANIFINTEHASFRLANIQANVFVGSLVGNVTGLVSSISNFSTTNLREGSNLYYSNDRVRSNVISLLQTLAGNNITIDANGKINSTATGGGGSGNITIVSLGTIQSSDTYVGGNSNIILTSTVVSAKDVIVTIDGLTQIPTLDYYVAGNVLAFTSAPPANSTIETKIISTAATNHSYIAQYVIHPFLLMGA